MAGRGRRRSDRRRRRHVRPRSRRPTTRPSTAHGTGRPRRGPVPSGRTGRRRRARRSLVRKFADAPPPITVVRRRRIDARSRLADASLHAATVVAGAVTASSYAIEPGVDVDHYLAAVDRSARCRPRPERSSRPSSPARSSCTASGRSTSTPCCGDCGQLRVELPVLDRRLHRRLARAPRRGRRTGRALASARRYRAPDRRRRQRRPDRRRTHRQHEEPDRAPRRDRRRARHPAALGELPRLGARAVDRHGRQRPAPRHADGRDAVAARAQSVVELVRALCRRRRRSAATRATRRSS